MSTTEHSEGLLTPGRERMVLLILAAVQFTSIVDFVVIMPLGPQLKQLLDLSPSQFGLIVSSYTFAAGLAGLVATMFLDRFARRAAFLTAFAGFLFGTLFCGLAPNFGTLLAARFLTGSFGGLLGGIALVIVSDIIPEKRRGAAIGALMSSFALASVVGVPIGLMLGLRYGWHVPFLALAGLGVPVWFLAARVLPRLDGHLRHPRDERPFELLLSTFTHPNHVRAFILTTALMFSSMAVLPYLSPYLVANVGFAESQLPLNFVTGGVLTLLASPLIGRLSDRFGKLFIYRIIAPANAVAAIVLTTLPPVHAAVAIAVVGAFMVSNAGRMVPAMALVTASVEPRRRGGFLGANAAVQHIAAGVGATFGGMILTQSADGKLIHHYPLVGIIAAVVTLASLWLAGRLRPFGFAHTTSVTESTCAAAGAMDPGEPITALETI
jgi:MFS transporter, DHA1 family, inner membrane transport protein